MPTKKNRAGEQQPYKSSDGEYADYGSSSSKTETTQQDASRVYVSKMTKNEYKDYMSKNNYTEIKAVDKTDPLLRDTKKDYFKLGNDWAKKIEVGKWYKFRASNPNKYGAGKVVAINEYGNPIIEKYFETFEETSSGKWHSKLPYGIKEDGIGEFADKEQGKVKNSTQKQKQEAVALDKSKLGEEEYARQMQANNYVEVEPFNEKTSYYSGKEMSNSDFVDKKDIKIGNWYRFPSQHTFYMFNKDTNKIEKTSIPGNEEEYHVGRVVGYNNEGKILVEKSFTINRLHEEYKNNVYERSPNWYDKLPTAFVSQDEKVENIIKQLGGRA